MRLRHDYPPSAWPDPLNIAGDVAHLVLAILQRSGLIAEDQSSQEDLPYRIAGKDQSDHALRPAELVEPLKPALGLHPAIEGGIGDIGQIPVALGADLDDSAAI